MVKQRKGHIAFIAIDDGSAISQPPRSGPNSPGVPIGYRQAAWQLAEQGWHVDVFAHHSEPFQVDHPRYREIFLPITLKGDIDRVLEALDVAAQAFLRYQESQGVLYPIIHTHCWASAWVGAQIKQRQLLRLVQTYQGPASLADWPRLDGSTEGSQYLDSADCLVTTDPSHLSRPVPGSMDSAHKLRLVSSTEPELSSAALAEQLNSIYREQINLLCRQFFFTSPVPSETQPTPPQSSLIG